MSNTEELLVEMDDQIEELLKQTNDAETRAVLLILYKIADTLQKNTEVTKKIVDDMALQQDAIQQLDTQIQAQVNTKNGMSRVFAWIIPVTQLVILSTWGYFYTDYVELKTSVTTIETKLEFIAKGVEYGYRSK